MKKYLHIPALVLTVLMTIGYFVLMNNKKASTGDIALGASLFFFLNYVLLALILKAFQAIFRVLRLPGLKLKSYAYYLYPLAMVVLYAAFCALSLRIAQYAVPDVLMLGLLGGGIAALLLAQLGGAFPQKRFNAKKRGYRLDGAGGALGGFEILGSLFGEYAQGIVLGTDTLEYEEIQRIRRAKDVLVMEGSALPQLEIILVTERAKQYFATLMAPRLGASLDRLLATDPAEGSKGQGPFSRKKEEPKPSKGLQRGKPVKLIAARAKEKQGNGKNEIPAQKPKALEKKEE